MLPEYLAGAALVVSAVALVLSFVALRRTRPGSRGSVSPPPAPGPLSQGRHQTAGPSDPNSVLATALRHVSVVRYDAFDDVTGRLSFTAALLDDRGDGLVITSLHARSESRTYLKGVVDGSPTGDGPDAFSPEEQRAVSYAQGNQE